MEAKQGGGDASGTGTHRPVTLRRGHCACAGRYWRACTHVHTHTQTPHRSVAPFFHIMRPNMINAIHRLFLPVAEEEKQWFSLCRGAFNVKSDEALAL